jgi:thymidylate synthase (FAD)
VAEHASFTFVIDEVSRALLAQITRHRMASFSVQSQRYCGVEPVWIVPPKFTELGLDQEYIEDCDRAYAKYCSYIERGAEEEDARYVIPQGVTCRMGVTMNARELRHFFGLRCCNRAQWEIRELADEMLRLCKEVAPMMFRDAGPGCVRGRCPEGKHGCKNPRKEGESK